MGQQARGVEHRHDATTNGQGAGPPLDGNGESLEMRVADDGDQTFIRQEIWVSLLHEAQVAASVPITCVSVSPSPRVRVSACLHVDHAAPRGAERANWRRV